MTTVGESPAGRSVRAHPPRETVRPAPPPRPEDAAAGLLARLATVVAAQPDAVALVDDRGPVTYAGFAELAARTARAVARLDLRRWAPGTPDDDVDPVAVLGAHRATTVAAAVGVMAAGSPVVVLDHALPHARLLQYVQRSGARALVCDPEHAERTRRLAADAGRAGVTVLEQPWRPDGDAAADAAARAGRLVPPGREAPDVRAPAALVYTSGTTGLPKGVVYDSRLFPRSAHDVSVRDGTYDADDVLASVLPLGFSAGLDHTLAGLQVGALQHMRDLRTVGRGDVVAWLRDSGVTVLNTSPSMARALVAQVPEGELLGPLRSLGLTSEAVRHSDVAALRRVLPAGCALSNRWGASETGLATVLPLLPGEHGEPGQSGQLPVGWPVGDVQLDVDTTVDDGGVAAAGTGTITVTAPHIARRYWRDPAATARVFTELPDGRIRFRSADVGRLDDTGCFLLLGRRDHSVKIRGYLVEPGEVEAALCALPDVRESVVVGVEGPSRTRLVAHVVSTADRPAAASIRARLREVLPPWMVPETVVFLDALPRTERGKVDRGALPPAPAPTPGDTRPRNDWEGLVASLWARVLQLPAVGVHDDFFELGGDSLAAEELLAAVVDELGVPAGRLDSRALLAASTVAEFAARLRGGPTGRGSATLVPLRPDGDGRPLFCVAGGGGLALAFLPLVRALPPELPVWGLQARGLESRAVPDWTVRAAARRHVRDLRTVQPTGPYRLLGYSFGAVLALEVARQLTAAGEAVEALVLVDAYPPGTPAPRPAGRGPLARARALAGLALTGLSPAGSAREYGRFYRQAQVLTAAHRPAPWRGDATVVVAGGEDADVRAAWGPFVDGTVETVAVGGTHWSALRPPHAATVAGHVARVLGTASAQLPRIQSTTSSGTT